MEYICPNCNNPIIENFCGNCGQKKFKRIDKKYVLDEVQYSLIHTNKGFLYSAKKILRNPGKTAREFIYGDRVNHYKPLLLVFLLSGISAFISFKIIHIDKIMAEFYSTKYVNAKWMSDMQTFLASYHSLIMLALVPVFAIFTKLALRKWGQNYYEHIIMNAYILSFYTFISIIFASPILFIVRHNSSLVILVTTILTCVVPIILVWFYKGFYPEKSIKTIIVKVLIILGLLLAAYFLLIILAAIIGIVAAMILSPETMQQFKPQ